MKYIANILTNSNITENLYNVTNKKSELIKGIPTLVIGWEFCKKNYDTSNIIEHKIDDLTYWTFGKREKRDQYEEFFAWFKDFSYRRFIDSIKYRFINVITEKNNGKDTFYGLFNNEKPFSYLDSDMIYIVKPNDSVVYGVSLRDFNYIGVDSEKIIKFIYRNSNIVSAKDKIPLEDKQFFRFNRFIIPFLFS